MNLYNFKTWNWGDGDKTENYMLAAVFADTVAAAREDIAKWLKRDENYLFEIWENGKITEVKA